MHAALKIAEHGEPRSAEPFLGSLLDARFTDLTMQRLQPMPLHRIVYHLQLGRPEVGSVRHFCEGLRRFEEFLAKIVPSVAWAYLHLRGTLRA